MNNANRSILEEINDGDIEDQSYFEELKKIHFADGVPKW